MQIEIKKLDQHKLNAVQKAQAKKIIQQYAEDHSNIAIAPDIEIKGKNFTLTIDAFKKSGSIIVFEIKRAVKG